MGKRKDRILAAMSNAGRRVKLDLSAEPSGDLGSSAVHDEVEKDTELKQRAGLPNSPSSSGQQQQNPLLLLGQYSDDEIDEESNERLKQTVAENSSADNENLVKGPCDERNEEKDVNTGKDLAVQEAIQQDKDGYVISSNDSQKPVVPSFRESDHKDLVHLQTEMSLSQPTSAAETPALQVIGDVSSGWRMVLHEESKQYYYWNVETGETSWEIPQVLAQTTELAADQRTNIIEDTQSTAVVEHECHSTIAVASDYYVTAPIYDGPIDGNMISESKDAHECGAQANERFEGSKGEVMKYGNGTVGVSQVELSGTGGVADSFSADGSLIGPGMHIQGLMNNEENITASDLSTGLVKRCEELLQKLKSLEGSKAHLQHHDWASKYVLEVEIRLSDFKSLLACGSSILPFWLHSERQLQRLEGAVDEEIYQIAKSQVDEDMATHISSSRGEYKSLELGHESQAEGNENNAILSTHAMPKVSPEHDSSAMAEKDLCKDDSLRITVHGGGNVASSESPARHLESDGEQVNGTVIPHESISKSGYNSEGDVDMDVDMEVEDSVPEGNTRIGETSSAKDFATLEQPVQPNPPADHPSLTSEDVPVVPPPPDEEWIPPPPPDNEQVPPPPPDEPPEDSYNPTTSYVENVQHHPYMEQYNIPYPDSSFAYYGHTVTEIPGGNFYGPADGSQVVPHASIYYGAVPNSYNETASVMVNPVIPVAYYGLQDGAITQAITQDSVGSSIESSQNNSQYGRVSDSALASDGIGTVDTHSEAGATVKEDGSAVRTGADMGSLGVPSTSVTIQAVATVSEKESVPSLSTTAVASAAAAATTSSAAKVQSKVRNKKRTVAVAPSLRSNKKVSSLVDKWKAAKEELNENEEDEPENAYEILERKRQREIEEWRAQQIASGEAKDNANFQPLGGDWREKVKRRRAQLAKEAAETPPEAEADRKQEKPDLVDLSKDLPSGWQAYWDESSKQIYYGNTITSKTTWTRPTK
ncbi:hypothetical protein AB3S75_020374 [Citrus x aurantiifolia]